MAEKVKWSTNVEVQNGPVFSFVGMVQPEAYEKIQVAVEPGDEGTAVSILPSADVKAQFLLIKATKYVAPDDTSKKLTYKVGDTERDLAGPLIMTDAAILGLLGDDLSTVTFLNRMADPVTVEILVCRNAGPSE